MAGNVHNFSDATFATDVQGDKLVLVDFWATWCGPCKAIAPALEALADEMNDTLKIGKVDVDGNRETAAKFNVRSIPTLILFKNGEPIDQIVGALPKDKIAAVVQKHL